jgi:hypothetical protein
MGGCRFAMLAIASPQRARTLFLKSLPISVHAASPAPSCNRCAYPSHTPAGTSRVRTNFTSVRTESALVL